MLRTATSSAWRARLCSLAVGLLVSGGLASSVIIAASKPAATTTPTSGQGLEISPPVRELSVKPGQSITTTVRIRDVTKGPLVVTGRADDFTSQGEDGNPKILLNESETSRYTMKLWVESVPGFRLVPGEIKTAVIKINVPANAEPGGHYGVIRFTGTPPELEGTGVSLSASIGMLVLLRVAGPITEKASLEEFFVTSRSKGSKQTLFESGPLNFIERIKNEGSVHLQPTGTIDIFDSFGKLVTVVPANQPPRNVLPDSIRRFEQEFKQKRLFGRYRARLNLSYGESKKSLAGSTVFWVIPYRLIGLVILALIIAFIVLRILIKNYNRRIIERSRRRR